MLVPCNATHRPFSVTARFRAAPHLRPDAPGSGIRASSPGKASPKRPPGPCSRGGEAASQGPFPRASICMSKSGGAASRVRAWPAGACRVRNAAARWRAWAAERPEDAAGRQRSAGHRSDDQDERAQPSRAECPSCGRRRRRSVPRRLPRLQPRHAGLLPARRALGRRPQRRASRRGPLGVEFAARLGGQNGAVAQLGERVAGQPERSRVRILSAPDAATSLRDDAGTDPMHDTRVWKLIACVDRVAPRGGGR